MNMVPVKSSNIAAIGHDGSTLRVEFNSGAVWEYDDVAPHEHAALIGAPSVGSHFNAHIKSGKTGRKVSDD